MSAQFEFTVVDGGCKERLALSLVHPRSRVDVPVRSLIKIEARSGDPFGLSAKRPRICDDAHIAVWLAPSIRMQISSLTKQIVGDPLTIMVDDEIVANPIVREPLGGHPSFFISIWDVAEAEAIAQKMRAGWRRTELRVVSREHEP